MLRITLAVSSLLALGVAQEPAGPAHLLLDIDDRPLDLPSSNPSRFTVVAGRIYFRADDGINGTELFVTDGVTTRLVEDVRPGPEASNPQLLGAFGNSLVFVADDGAHGVEPWITDGTPVGTFLLTDANPGTAPSSVDSVHDLGGRALFFAREEGFGQEPWVTDGSSAGTHRLADIAPGPESSASPAQTAFRIVRQLPSGQRVLWFIALVQGQTQLWETDGTALGTRSLCVFPPAASGSMGVSMEVPSGRVVFISTDYFIAALWSTDGTAAGTVRVGQFAGWGSRPILFAGRAWFGGVSSWSFLSTDGTLGGTYYHRTPATTPAVDYVAPLGETGGSLWGIARAGPVTKLIRADATQVDVTDAGVLPFMVDTTPLLGRNEVPRLGDRFLVTDDSSPPGLRVVRPPTLSGDHLGETVDQRSTPYAAMLGNRAVFAINLAARGVELGITDGTAAGTSLLADLMLQHPAPRTLGSDPREFVAFGSRVAFRTTLPSTDLWITDGTRPGTQRISQGLDEPRDLTPCGDRLFFSARTAPTGRELYVTDGTLAGTRLVGETVAGPVGGIYGPMAALATEVAFLASGALFASDGSVVREIARLPFGSSPWGAFRLGARVIYGGTVLVGSLPSFELWSTDLGSGAPTQFATVPTRYEATWRSPVVWRDRLWLIGADAAGTMQLWSTDGTAAGTAQFGHVNSTWYDGIEVLVAGDDRLFVVGGAIGIWVTDGVTGPTQLAYTGPGPRMGMVPPRTLGGRLLFHTLADIRITDGTPGGTHRVAAAPPSTNLEGVLLPAGRHDVLFAGPSAATSRMALWRTDGRPDSAIELQAIEMPWRNDHFAYSAAAGGRLVFVATHPRFGNEPYAFDPEGSVQVRGAGCGVGPRTPSLVVDYDPRGPSGSTLAMRGFSSLGSLGIVFVSPDPGRATPLGAAGRCALEIDPQQVTSLRSAPLTQGRFTAAIQIPSDPSLFGIQFVLQATIAPTDTPVGFDLTEGVLVTLGS